MKVVTSFIAAAALLASAVVVTAQEQASNAVRGLALQPRTKPAPNNGVSKQLELFRSASAALAKRTGNPPAKPTVVCGMMLIAADPTIDPKIVKHPPQEGTTFTMKKVQPSSCTVP